MIIETRGLSRTYPDEPNPVRAVDDLSLAVAEGQHVSVMGPSGCGKSTLLHLLGGLERPRSTRRSSPRWPRATTPADTPSCERWAPRPARRRAAFSSVSCCRACSQPHSTCRPGSALWLARRPIATQLAYE
jgi:energy-coupling factor transporter ATP-binding protein EcfA2